jgi:hypothetical protein
MVWCPPTTNASYAGMDVEIKTSRLSSKKGECDFMVIRENNGKIQGGQIETTDATVLTPARETGDS